MRIDDNYLIVVNRLRPKNKVKAAKKKKKKKKKKTRAGDQTESIPLL